MKKKIRLTLGLKVFLLTSLLLLFCNLIICLLISFFTPQTYSTYLEDSLNTKVYQFLEKLKDVPYRESGSLFETFSRNPDILSVELLDEAGKNMPLPMNITDNHSQAMGDAENTAVSEEAAIHSSAMSMTAVFSDEPASYTLQEYDLSFQDKNGCTLLVYGNSEPVHQLQETFRKLFPFLTLILVLVSLVFSFFYSRLIARLQKDLEKEKQLEKARLEFFSAASHELKTPVTVIKGQLEGMLFNVGVYKNHEKYLARSLEATVKLEGMIQDLLISSRLDTPDYHISFVPVNLSELTMERLALTGDLFVEKNLSVHSNIEPELWVKGDKNLLDKVIGNLISNALFYSPEDNDIFISLNCRGYDILFCIENTGVHIPDDLLSRIFDPFYRVDQSRNKSSGGSGLGLSIVRKILKIHGSFCVAQNTEKGVRFSFRLPRQNYTENTK